VWWQQQRRTVERRITPDQALHGLDDRGRGDFPRRTARPRVRDHSFHGASTVCFRFAHLHGFIDATVARIHSSADGRSGPVIVTLSGGPKLHHRGCLAISPTVGRAISSRPSAYYVNVHSRRYPHGAVRAQL
jgi:hypothetical protein